MFGPCHTRILAHRWVALGGSAQAKEVANPWTVNLPVKAAN